MSQTIINWIIFIFQILIAFGLLNVWLVRFSRATKYRGGNASNMKQEFSTYGLPSWSLYVVGFFKIAIALIIIASIFVPSLMYPFGVFSLMILFVLMIGAISMHIKVRDSFIKMLPAILMFSMSFITIYLFLLGHF